MIETGTMVEKKRLPQSKLNHREFMRARHPDLFSDTSVDFSPRLPRAVFEYHLETLTSRKQEYEFEYFCRKLAEKEICPNLRVQTGPTGGGDSKVDSETYPIATEIAERWWIGDTSAGSERWAFAFSAKKAWQPKVRADVEGIVSTGREYKRIYFFTNQFVSDKSRAKFEDELFRSSGIPIHIVDRSWIVAAVYEHDHLAMAIATLGIDGAGEEKQPCHGPLDSARLAELKELDKQISDPSRYQNAQYQLAEDCLRGAILARGLERSRHEVEGRFSQAERLAQAIEISHQLGRIAYTRAWTSHWWYEDYDAFIRFYDEVELYVANSMEAADLERLLNLWHVLITIESQGMVSKEVARSKTRQANIKAMFNIFADDTARPNNALQAKTNLIIMSVTEAIRNYDLTGLDAVWTELIRIVDESSKLGQYSVVHLANMVREFGNFTDSAVFDTLYEKITNAMQQRRSDGEAGNAYRERGIQKLQHGLPYDAIRWIGRAEELLVKEEYQGELIKSLIAGSFAYERAGLLWAARNKILVAAERTLHAFVTTGEMPFAILGIFQRLTWIELQLGRIPHVLQSMSWASFASMQLTLSEENQTKYVDEIQLQESILGIHLLNIPFDVLPNTECLPDVLERLGLTNARLAILFALGHNKRINIENYFPPETNAEDIHCFFEKWQDQPAAMDIPSYPNLIEAAKTTLRSVILGSEFVIISPSNPTSLGVAESLLGALEAFLATSDEADLLPHAELTTIIIRTSVHSDGIPTFNFCSDVNVDAEIICSSKVLLSTVEDIHGFSDWLRDTVIKIVAHQFVIRDLKNWMARVNDECAFSRAILLGNILTIGRNIFGNEPSVRLSDWIKSDEKIYECIRTQPWRKAPLLNSNKSTSIAAPKFGSEPAPDNVFEHISQKHTERQVMSPIDLKLWNQAKWCGTLFAMAGRPPPILGLMFDDANAGQSIFADWRVKWGIEDLQDNLRILIVTGVSAQNPAHYVVVVGPNINRCSTSDTNIKTFVSVSRINRMTPATSTNLDTFLSSYQRFGVYKLIPTSMGNSSKLDMTNSLQKRHLHVRPAWQIEINDPDIVALADNDDPVVPAGILEPPVKKALEWIRAMRRGKAMLTPEKN